MNGKIEISGTKVTVKPLGLEPTGMTCGIIKSGVRFEMDGIAIEVDCYRSQIDNRNLGVELLEHYIKLRK